jgi:CubicO group peptidase (beta-lactamase class C family)
MTELGSSDTERDVWLPDSESATTLPAGWRSEEKRGLIQLTGPENDLHITYVVLDNTGSTRDIARSAWLALEPGFDADVAFEGDDPSNTDGWDRTSIIQYRTLAAQSRIVIGYVRVLGARAYVNLIGGSKAGYGRREAQLAQLIGAWRPAGLSKASLTDRVPAEWSATQSDALRSFVDAAMKAAQIPGVAIAIVQHGKVVYCDGFGVRSLETLEPVTPSTRFMIGSTTKALTTLMMGCLIDQGYFSWSTPIVELLPDFALADRDLTCRMQMRHTVSASTGMPRRDMDLLFNSAKATPERRLAEMKTMTPTTGFGETFQYSNYLVAAGGYAAAHSYASALTLGAAYDAAMQRFVFDPLGMRNTSLHTDTAINGEAAMPHAIDFDGRSVGINIEIEKFVEAVAPAGAIWSSAEDMSRYLLLELNEGCDDDAALSITRETLEDRRRPGIRIDDHSHYGLGLLRADLQGLDMVGHGGNTMGFSSDMYFFPAHRLGVVVLTNLRAANSFLQAVQQKILELVFSAKPAAEQTIASSSKNRESIVTATQGRFGVDADAVAWIHDLVGSYRSDELGSAHILQKDGGYWIQFDNWGSSLGSERQADGQALIVLLTSPWSGNFRFAVNADRNELRLDAGQSTYVFVKQ